MRKTIFILALFFAFTARVSAQSAIGVQLGYGGVNTDLGSSFGSVKGIFKTFQYRWYKYDRGFRTLRLTHFSGSQEVTDDMYDYQRTTELKRSGTTLQYDANFMMFKSEIEDKFMSYIGAGWLVSVWNDHYKYKYSNPTINKTDVKESGIVLGMNFKLGFDVNINSKFAIATEYNFRIPTFLSSAFVISGSVETGVLYKLY